jgi:hypothetical protein
LVNKNDDTLTSDVTGRLNDFFGTINQSDTSPNDQNNASPQEYPLTELNAILLSIEWEITDEILQGLSAEIERLKESYRDDKILFSFLQLHGSVGKYISSKKVTAHPDSIKLLHSIYDVIEQVVKSPAMSAADKKRLLTTEVNKFKALRKQILLAKKEASREMTIKPSETLTSPAQDDKISAQESEAKIKSQDLAVIIEEIKKIIKVEFKALRAELKLLINNK